MSQYFGEHGPSSNSTYFDDLGKGVESPFGEEGLSGRLFDNAGHKPESNPRDSAAFYYEAATSTKSWEEIVSASSRAKASFGLFGGKMKAKYLRVISSNSYSCYVLGLRRITRPRIVLGDAPLTDATQASLDHLLRYPNDARQMLADEFISKIGLQCELGIRLEIKTRSDADYIEVSGKMALAFPGGGGGKGSFSHVKKELSTARESSFMAFGAINGDVVSVSMEEADEMLLKLPSRATSNDWTIYEQETEGFWLQDSLQKYKHLFDFQALSERVNYCNYASAIDSRLGRQMEDCKYIMDTANKDEFLKDDISSADDLLHQCEEDRRELKQTVEAAKGYWRNRSVNGNEFELHHLKVYDKRLKRFARVERTHVAAAGPIDTPSLADAKANDAEVAS